MSGWIKVEKDLANDPRVLRMASRLRHADVTLGSRSRLVIVGALVTLWWFADTHIREDDTLPIGTDQINELVGIDNFCDLMPTEWLQVIDADSVKLVDYTTHNGTTAKKRALNQKRQERCRNANADVTLVSRSRNANSVTRPREDLDQEKTLKSKRVPTEPVELECSTAEPRPDPLDHAKAQARATAASVQQVFDHWRTVHHHERAALDEKRVKLIRKALDHYTEADLCQSISGYLNSPHHMGQNDRQTVYTDLELLLRDAGQIDNGLKFYAQPPRTDLSSLTRRNIDATAEWVPPEMRRATS